MRDPEQFNNVLGNASALPITQPAGAEPVSHGGNLDAARNRFPGAPEPWIDLSTGINPVPFPIPELPAEVVEKTRAKYLEAYERLTGKKLPGR